MTSIILLYIASAIWGHAFAKLKSIETHISTSLKTFDGPNDDLMVDREASGSFQAVNAII